MENMEYTVFVRIDAAGHIIEINSSEFITDTTGWIEIDHGTGDRYHHAQGNYFPERITTDVGAYRYKLVDGVPAECTLEEIAAQEAANPPTIEPDPVPSGNAEEQLAAMAAAIERGLTT